MSNLPVQQPPQTVEAKDVIEFVPWGTEDKIKLSLNIVRNIIAVKAYDRNSGAELLPDNSECMKFMMLCRSRRLNPFEGDAFMVPFWDGKANKHVWSLITAHNAYLKRAETHPEFNGFQSGVILETDNGDYVEIEGDFVPKQHYDEERDEYVKVSLVGGWARVYFKQRQHPVYRRAALATFAQSFGQWVKNSAGMIVKVAESDALRSAFPTLLGGLFLKEEIEIESEVTVAPSKPQERRPEFAKGLPAPSMGTQPAAKPAAPPKPALPAAKPEPVKAEPVPEPERTEPPQQEQTAQPDPAPQTGVAPEPEPEDGQQAPTEQAGPPENLLPVVKDGDSPGLRSAKGFLIANSITEKQALRVLIRKSVAKNGQKLNELSESKLQMLSRASGDLLAEIKAEPWE